jgi:hypothetical protein
MESGRVKKTVFLEDAAVDYGWPDVAEYSPEQIADALEIAEILGFDVGPGSALESITVGELMAFIKLPHES